MNVLVRAEVVKLRTLRSTYGLLLAVAGLTALFTALEASRAGRGSSSVAPLSTSAGLSTVTTLTGWSMLFAAVLGVMASSGEFRHRTATLTYLAVPDRVRVLVAKGLAIVVPGALFGLVAGALSTGCGLAVASARGDVITLGAGTLTGHIAGAMVGAALWAVVGVGLGSLLRSQVAAIIAVFLWGLVVESVVGGLFTAVRPYLPYTAATTLAGIRLGGAAIGPAHGVSGGGPLPFVAAAGLVLGVALAVGVVAATTSVRRDID